MVKGVDIDFTDTPAYEGQGHNAVFSPNEQNRAIDTEIEDLLRKGVTQSCNFTEGEYISPIFVTPKKDNRFS